MTTGGYWCSGEVPIGEHVDQGLIAMLAFAAGLGLIVAGITWVYPPAGLIVAGLALTGLAIGYSRGA